MAKRSDRISILDIARQVGVSPATVSRVFNFPEQVSAATREQILAVARQHGYRPNASARTLRTQRSGVVGVLLPTLTNPVFAECLQGITQGTAAHGYAIMPATTDYRVAHEIEAVERLLAFGVDGVILVVSDAATSQAIALLRKHGTPYVLVYNRHPAHPCVSVAGDVAVSEQVGRLVAQGHRRIAMVCGQLRASDRAQQRYAGFVKGMERAGLRPSALIEVPFVETAIENVSQALRANPQARPTALICSNDLLAIRAMRAAFLCGLGVPQDISVTGFDGIRLGQDLTPALSSIAQPNQEMGQAAVDLLVRSIAQGRSPQATESITLQFHFQAGGSCGRPNDDSRADSERK